MRATDAPPATVRFYASVIDEAELVSAMSVDGIDEELAVLRVRLRKLLMRHPADYDLMLKSIGLLVRAAGTRYRMSARSREDLAETLGELLKHMSVQLFPQESDV